MLHNASPATDEILKEELDTIIELVKSKDTEFYNQYRVISIVQFGLLRTLAADGTIKHDTTIDAAVEARIVRE